MKIVDLIAKCPSLAYEAYLEDMRLSKNVTEIENISSSNIKEMFFAESDAEHNDVDLFVTFHSRYGDPDRVYVYHHVPMTVIDSLIESNETPLASIGGIFNELVKKGNYEYEAYEFWIDTDD